jgi:cytoskeletal protein RodZ
VAPSSTVSATGAELLTVPTDGDLETGSSLSTAGPDQSAILPVVPQTLPARVESTTAPPPTVAPTTQSAAPPTTAPPATTTTVAPTTTTTVAPASTTAVPTTEPSTTSSRGSAIVVGDAYELKSGKGGKFEILDNDGDRALLDEGTLQITVAPAHADKFRVHNDHIHYESDGDYEGTDSLRYRVCTFDGACGAATVTIRLIDD